MKNKNINFDELGKYEPHLVILNILMLLFSLVWLGSVISIFVYGFYSDSKSTIYPGQGSHTNNSIYIMTISIFIISLLYKIRKRYFIKEINIKK